MYTFFSLNVGVGLLTQAWMSICASILRFPQMIHEYGKRRWNDIDRRKPKNVFKEPGAGCHRSYMNPVRTHGPSSPESHFVIILPPIPRLGSFPYGFPTKTLCAFLIFPVHAACIARIIVLHLITQATFGEHKLWRTSLSISLWPPVTSYLLSAHILLITLLEHLRLYFLFAVT
jgi:hypothetical protein